MNKGGYLLNSPRQAKRTKVQAYQSIVMLDTVDE